MSSYYNSDDKITFDEALMYVDRYIRLYRKRKTIVKSTDVARAFDIERNRHNLIRINKSLKHRLEVEKYSGNSTTKFKM